MTRIINGVETSGHDHSGDYDDGGTFDAANLTSGSASDGQVLTSDGIGGAAWETLPLVGLCQGRLTLTTGVPVTTAAVTGATTLYFTPYKGNAISLYDGVSRWDVLTFTERSITLVGLTASKPYDVFAYNNAGTVTLELLVWTDATNRATALAFQDGIYVKSGATTRRYLGTIYINSSGGQTDDAPATRFVWNYYNRLLRELVKSSFSNHTYNTSAFRAWNNDTANKAEYIVGLIEDGLHVSLVSSTEDGLPAIYVNIDSFSLGSSGGAEVILNTTTAQAASSSFIYPQSTLAIGYHYLGVSQRQWTSTGTYWYYILSAMLFG